jgi:radical SAM protein with 4Fe4S-binding SPASM domain
MSALLNVLTEAPTEPAAHVDPPSYVQIEPVGQCNLRCTMCPILYRKDGPPYGPPAFMPFESFVRLIDELPGTPDLHLQGLGEPMMHPRFFDMVEYAAAKGMRVTTNTNMTLLTERRAKQCVESGLYTLHVSIDGATAATYERIRVRARWPVLMRNLELLRDARREAGSDLPHLHLVMVVMRQNLHELPDIVRLAHEWSFEEVFVQHLCHDFSEETLPAEYRPMRNFVHAETLVTHDPARIDRFFNEAKIAARDLGIKLRLPGISWREHAPGTPGPERCDWPWRGAYVSYDGYAMPCCMIATPDRLNFGNVMEKGFQRIWQSRSYEAFRGRLDSDDPPEVCRSCSIYRGTF